MTNRREREIKDTIAKVGLQVVDFDQSGPHIKVKVCHPLMRDRQKTFTYGRGSSGDIRRCKNEEAALIRWKREITEPPNHHLESPIEAAWKKAGLPVNDRLPPPIIHIEPQKKVHLVAQAAQAAARQPKWTANTPVHPDEFGGSDDPQYIATEVELAHGKDPRNDPVLNAFINSNPDVKAHVEEKVGPRATYTPPEPAKEPDVAKEPTMNETSNPPQEQPARKKHVFTKKREQMSFAEVMKFGSWMSKEKLEGYYTKTEFLEHATKTLGFRVSDAALDSWLDENGVQMPQRPQATKPKSWQEQVNDDLAAIALAVADSIPDGPHRNLLLAIVDRRTRR